jgi:predicted MFS family arabinose efflux permease
VPRDFVKLWAGQTVSLFGSEVTSLALPLVAAAVLGAGPAEMGLLRAAQFVPELLALPVGLLVDRVHHRRLLMLADLGRALLLGSIPLAALRGSLQLPQLYVIALLSGALTVVFGVAYQAYLPSLLEPPDRLQGNSRLALSRSTAIAAGPALAGALVQAFSAPLAILADAASFVVSAASLLLIRAPDRRAVAGRHADLLGGLRFVLRDPLLRTVALASAIWNFFSGGVWDALYVVHLSRGLQLSAVEIGGLFTTVGLAGVASALLSSRVLHGLGIGPAYVGAGVLASVAMLVIASSSSVLLIGLAAACVGSSFPVFLVASATIQQECTPEPLRGRVAAGLRSVVVGVVPLGALLGGALGEALSPRAGLVLAALGLLLVPLSVFASPVRRLHTLAGRVPSG